MVNKYIENLIDLGAMVGGRKIIDRDFVLFERLSKEELENIKPEELAFATQAMGRAIFSIDEDGKIINYKGVDSHLVTEELSLADLIGVESVYFANNNTDYSQSHFPINLVNFSDDEHIEIRMRGASYFSLLKLESDINNELQGKGIKLPKITNVREFDEEFCEKYGLPIKVSSEQRKETFREYFERIGLEKDIKVQNFLNRLGIDLSTFIDNVDNKVAPSQRYGQMIREVESPFRIADIEYYVKQGNIEVLHNMIGFMESMYPNRVPMENYFATQMGINLANLLNNNWECKNFMHRQDYTLAGEMCDDAYRCIASLDKDIDNKTEQDSSIKQIQKRAIRIKALTQIYFLSSTVKYLQDEMALRGKTKEERDSVLSDFLDNFIENLNLEKTSQNLFGTTDSSKLIEAFSTIVRTPKDIVKLVSYDFRNNTKINKEIFLAHDGLNSFYDEVSDGLAKRLGIERTFINQSQKDIDGPEI